MHFLGKWLRLPMAIEILMHFWMCSITLPSSTDVNSFRKRLWRSNESTHFTEYLEGVSGIAIQHIRWRLQSSKHVSERAGGWFFSIGPSVLIGLCFFYRVETSAPGLSGHYWYIVKDINNWSACSIKCSIKVILMISLRCMHLHLINSTTLVRHLHCETTAHFSRFCQTLTDTMTPTTRNPCSSRYSPMHWPWHRLFSFSPLHPIHRPVKPNTLKLHTNPFWFCP